MIGAVIRHMEKHLPEDEIFVLSLGERFFEQHIVPQRCKIITHLSLNLVPVCANDLPIRKVSGSKRLWEFAASQPAKPCVISADEMNDLISNRAMRVVHSLRELFL